MTNFTRLAIYCLVLCFICQVYCGFVHAAPLIHFSKSSPHYARDMEFYYQNPRPEVLQGLLNSFARDGVLARSENRLMLGAFLAELARHGGFNLRKFAMDNSNSDHDSRQTLAWSMRLAGLAGWEAIADKLLNEADAPLAGQLRRMPANLAEWNIHAEKSVQQMYWGAFMASGNITWVDAIIDLALASASSYPSRHEQELSNTAAASLYDLAPRHPPVAARLRARLDGSQARERQIMETILSGTAKQP